MIGRWTSAPTRGLLQAAVALLMLASVPVKADTVPGLGSWEMYHNSHDPSPVTVRFVYNDGTRDLQIPRKYIVFAEGKHSSRDGPIPDLIETRSVKLVLTYPDGEAWSVATRDYMQEHGVGPETAAAEMRDRMHIVELLPSNRTLTLDVVRDNRNRRGQGAIGELGLVEYKIGRGSQTFFLGTEQDNFIQAICYNPSNPSWLCKYGAYLTPHIFFNADFVDLRIFGGLAFANHRIEMIKNTLCSFPETC